MSYRRGWGLGQRRLLCGPYTPRLSVLGTSTPKHPGLSPAAKVTLPPPSLAPGQQEGFGHAWQRQDLKLKSFPRAPLKGPEWDDQEC